jgi:hypothetical protein
MRSLPSGLAWAALLVASGTVSAQTGAWIRPELRAFVGAFMPGGSVGRYLGTTVGMESAVELTDFVDGVVSVTLSREHATVAMAARHDAAIWQYHVGLEFNSAQPRDNDWIWRPFAGGGLGARTYDYAEPGIPPATYPDSYGSLGLDVQGGATAYRVEARGYLSPFRPPRSGTRQVRADVTMTAGLAYHF